MQQDASLCSLGCPKAFRHDRTIDPQPNTSEISAIISIEASPFFLPDSEFLKHSRFLSYKSPPSPKKPKGLDCQTNQSSHDSQKRRPECDDVVGIDEQQPANAAKCCNGTNRQKNLGTGAHRLLRLSAIFRWWNEKISHFPHLLLHRYLPDKIGDDIHRENKKLEAFPDQIKNPRGAQSQE